MNKLISIIIPVKNGEKYLKEALLGIKKQDMDTEIIVIDDGSNDSTVKIAEEFGTKIISNKISYGPVKAKNEGLKVANGEFIMFHDHDDIMVDGALKKLYDELLNSPEFSAVQAKVLDFISPDSKDKNTKARKEPYFGLFTGAILIRKESFNITGPFDESVMAGEIIDWQGKTEKAGLKIKKIDFISTKRRLHDTNFGKTDRAKEFEGYAAILRARLRKK